MNHYLVLVSLAFVAATSVYAKDGYGPGKQDYGFVDVRKGAHMFYWLYYTTANVTSYTERPLVIWLQGGLSGSSAAIGIFKEIGPLDINGNYRESNWVKDMNVLFIDNTVGSGFSYVDKNEYLPKNNNQIALDLVRFMKGFYSKHAEFEDIPLHIFGQGYGGKVAAQFALKLHRAIKRKELKCKLSTVALGNPWISPVDSLLAWTPLLLYLGFVDKYGLKDIAKAVDETLQLVHQGKWINATEQFTLTQVAVGRVSDNVDFFNIIKPISTSTSEINRDVFGRTFVGFDETDKKLLDFMRRNISVALDIPPEVEWGSQIAFVLLNIYGDFFKPVENIVRKLLDTTDLKVAVYSGQFDLLCPTAGTVNWIEKLKWKDRKDYLEAPRRAFSIDSIVEGYEKSDGKFTMFWVNRAGHMVPVDNPAAMSYILKKLTNYG